MDASRPAGLISLSRTTTPIDQYLADYGSTVLPGVATHNLTLYRASSGALVFSAGTIQWSWGLGMRYDGGPQPASQPMQQATLNVLADMSVRATTPLSGLVAASKSTDDTAPVAAITGSSTGSGAGSRTVVTGTATDTGGVVAGVEVSTDNGVSWRPASGTSNWSYTFDARGVRTMQVRARAIDDSGNIGATTDPTDVTSTCPCTMLGSETPAILGSRDGTAANGLELGLRFRSSTPGTATALRFFRGVGDSSTHVGRLYRSDGALLAQATFPPSTSQGWEEAALTTPVQLVANQDYVTTTHLANTYYAVTSRVFASGSITASPLTALGSVYRYGPGGVMPTNTYQGENYFADVKFETGAPVVDTTAPVMLIRTPSAGATGIEPDSQVSMSFDEPLKSGASITLTTSTGSLVSGTTTWDPATLTLSFKPSRSLPLGQTLTVNLSGIQDLSGNASTIPSWDFTVADVAGASIFGLALPQVPSANDTAAVEVGTRFTPSAAGAVTGIRFYKGTLNTGTHVGRIYTSTGTKVSEVTFNSESDSGWQTAILSPALDVTAGATYTVSLFAPNGGYAYTSNFFASPFASGDLTATAGVYRYGVGGTVPTSTYNNSNYWVDVLYSKATADTTAPAVTGRTPAVDATGVTLNTTVSVTLDEAITSGYAVSLTPQGGSPVTGTTAWDNGTRTLTFTPGTALTPSTQYAVAITGIKDAAGNTTPTVTWSFTTAAPADTTAPAVTGRTPAVDATGVTLNTTVSVTLDEAITSGYAVSLTPQGGSPVTGTTAWDNGTRTLTFTPGTALTPSTQYAVAITGIKDAAGNTTPTVTWSFTTAAPADTTAPAVTGRTPAVDATGVTLNTTVSVTLDEAITSGYAVSLTPQGGSPVTGTTAWDNGTRTLTFTPGTALTPSTQYAVAITGIKDAAGNTTPTVTWSFTTAAPADTTAPAVTGRTPAVDATGVTLNTTVSVTLDEAITSGYAVSLTPQGGSPVTGTTAWDNGTRTLTFTPGTALTPSTQYAVAITGIKDAAGNTTPTVTWSFTTAAPADTTAPAVTGRTPAVDATGVTLNTTVSVTLDEAITSGYAVSLTPQGGSPVTGTTAWDNGTRTLTFTPGTALTPSTQYAVAITGIKDAAGNTTPTVTWSFTTAAPADTTAPAVTGRTPAVDATGVTLNTTVSVTLDEAITSGYAVSLTPQGGSPVTGTTAWDNGTRTLTFTPGTALTPSTQYAVAITGIKDAAGNTTPTVTWSFTTGDEATIFGTAVPNASVSTDTRSTEVGVKFTVSVNGYVTAIRFYKGAGNTGTHVGRLWLGTTLMASAVFEGETATGWQTVQLSEPVPITTGRTYTVTYYAPAGRFSTTPNYFSSAKTSNPFTATTGVFRRGTGGVLPTSTTTTNYWVDATFSTKVPPAQTLFATGVPATQSGNGHAFGRDRNPVHDQLSRLRDGSEVLQGCSQYRGTTWVGCGPTAGRYWAPSPSRTSPRVAGRRQYSRRQSHSRLARRTSSPTWRPSAGLHPRRACCRQPG